MTLSASLNRRSYAGDGSTVAFSFPYKFSADADLVVVDVLNSTGAETVKTLTTHYTVAGEGVDAGGTVTMLTAPAVGHTLVIYGNPVAAQSLDLEEDGPMPAEATEDALDYIMMVMRRMKDLIERAVRLPDGYIATFDAKLPPLISASPGAVLCLNSAGDAFEVWADAPTADDIADAGANATAAAASATAAAASATAAASSASAAATSATAAAASATAAAASATSINTVSGSTGSPNLIAAGGVIPITAGALRQTVFIAGNAAAVTTGGAYITAGTVVGQELTLISTSASNTVTITDGDGTGTEANGDIVHGLRTISRWVWDGTRWCEIGRNGL